MNTHPNSLGLTPVEEDLIRRRQAAAPLAAHVSIGGREYDLYGEPRAGQVSVPGTAAVTAGRTLDGRPFVIATTSIEYIDDLISALYAARAAGIVEAGMAVRT